MSARLDDLRCHTGQKVLDKTKRNHMMHVHDQPYSPDLGLCDFWLFGLLKNRTKETVFRNLGEVMDFVCNFWSEATLDEVQLAFHE
jgi:hypothetical protein